VLSYRVVLDVPLQLASFLAELLADHRRDIGTRHGTRALTCWKQAVFALAWFRDRPDIPRLGDGFGISQATAYRYLDEAIEVLAARAPGLREALEKAKEQGLPYLILDGKVVAADRCKEKTISRKGREIDRWYSGKAHGFRGNIQALFTPGGIPLWVSAVLPGGIHDITAARELVLAILRPLLKNLPVLADSGYEGAGCGVHVPVRNPAGGRDLDINTRTRNEMLRWLRCLGERGFRPDVPAVAHPAARHAQPRQHRRHRPGCPRPGPVRAQDDHVKVATAGISAFRLGRPRARRAGGAPELGQLSAHRCRDRRAEAGLLDQGWALPAESGRGKAVSEPLAEPASARGTGATSRDAVVAAARAAAHCSVISGTRSRQKGPVPAASVTAAVPMPLGVSGRRMGL
jgi:hypothetical protein